MTSPTDTLTGGSHPDGGTFHITFDDETGEPEQIIWHSRQSQEAE